MNLSRHARKISDVIKRAKAWKQEDLINVLNPIITGWSNYPRSAVAKEIFSKLDHIVGDMLCRGG
jgi:RNA-directed DNA polymerase